MNMPAGLHKSCSENKKEGFRMLPVYSFDDCSPWAVGTETISRIDKKAELFVVILNTHRGIINMIAPVLM